MSLLNKEKQRPAVGTIDKEKLDELCGIREIEWYTSFDFAGSRSRRKLIKCRVAARTWGKLHRVESHEVGGIIEKNCDKVRNGKTRQVV